LVLQGQFATEVVRRQHRLHARLSPAGLGRRLRHHRNLGRVPRHLRVPVRLLPSVLHQAQAPQVDERPRRSAFQPLARQAEGEKEAEADDADHETSRNTTYNQLNSKTAVFDDADRAEEGRIEETRSVPILQPAPVAKRAGGQAAPGALKKPPQFAKLSKEADAANLPTGRSVSFMPGPPPGSSGSR